MARVGVTPKEGWWPRPSFFWRDIYFLDYFWGKKRIFFILFIFFFLFFFFFRKVCVMHAHPSFGMTLTQAIRDLFARRRLYILHGLCNLLGTFGF